MMERQADNSANLDSFEGKTIHTEARYLCHVSGLEIWAPWPLDKECSFHFLIGYAYTAWFSTEVLRFAWKLEAAQTKYQRGSYRLIYLMEKRLFSAGQMALCRILCFQSHAISLHNQTVNEALVWHTGCTCTCGYPSSIPVLLLKQTVCFHLLG